MMRQRRDTTMSEHTAGQDRMVFNETMIRV